MSKRLAGKIAIVTGATSGIGKGIARAFALEGARVLLTGRNTQRGEAAMEEIVSAGVARENLAFHAADLSNVEQCRSVVAQAIAVFGALDTVVNNAGDASRNNIEDITVEEWSNQIATNLRAPFIITQAAVPHLQARGGGAILNIGSVNAYIGEPHLLAYSASKGGLMTFTKNVANYLGRYRIRVNQLNVGWTLTEGEDRIMREETGNDDWLCAAEGTRPFGRMLLPQDVSQVALFFASDESALISGAVLDVEQYPANSRGTEQFI